LDADYVGPVHDEGVVGSTEDDRDEDEDQAADDRDQAAARQISRPSRLRGRRTNPAIAASVLAFNRPMSSTEGPSVTTADRSPSDGRTSALSSGVVSVSVMRTASSPEHARRWFLAAMRPGNAE
jgi:hypothetical protein